LADLAARSRTGRKGPYACYYVHCEPGKSFVGGGLWHPDGPALQKIRESIDERPRRWRRVLNNDNFKRTFLSDVASKAGEEAALKEFAKKNQENALKTKPKVRVGYIAPRGHVQADSRQGFIADHRDIELLKLRNYTVSTKIDDKTFTSRDGPGKIVETVDAMVGFVSDGGPPPATFNY
jgi:uncharacterized protein (TIGR02453 family)